MKKHIIPFFFIILVIAILIIILVRSEVRGNVNELEQIKNSLTYDLAAISEDTKDMRMDFVKAGLKSSETDVLLQNLYKNNAAQIISALTFDKKGKLLKIYPQNNKLQTSINSNAQLSNIIEKQDPFLSEGFKLDSKHMIMVMGYPIWDQNNKFSGAMGVAFSLTEIMQKTKPVYGKLDDFWLLQKDGSILYDSKQEFIGENIFKNKLPFMNEQLKNVAKTMHKFPEGEAKIEFGDKIKSVSWYTLNFKERCLIFMKIK